MWQALLLCGLSTTMVSQKISQKVSPTASPEPAAPADAPLHVHFAVTPVLAEPGAAPRLIVEARNASARALPFMRFDSARCFAHHFLKLSLQGPGGPIAVDTTCPVRSWPGAKGTLEVGAVERRTLDLKELFPTATWAAGRYELQLAWDCAELRPVFGGAYAWRASQTSRRSGSFTLAKAIGRGRAEKGKELVLPDGARLKLLGHGHKEVMAGEPESPLIVYGAFAPSAKAPLEEFSFNVFTREGGLLPVADRTFVLGDYAYDSWMDVTCFGALPSGP